MGRLSAQVDAVGYSSRQQRETQSYGGYMDNDGSHIKGGWTNNKADPRQW